MQSTYFAWLWWKSLLYHQLTCSCFPHWVFSENLMTKSLQIYIPLSFEENMSLQLPLNVSSLFFFCLSIVTSFTTLHNDFFYVSIGRICRSIEVYLQIKSIRTLRLKIWLIYVFTNISIQILTCNLCY